MVHGGQYQVWDLGYSGTFTGDVTVVLHYDPANFAGGTPYVWHDENGIWVMPPNQVVDPVTDTITFTTDRFSPFLISNVPEHSTWALLAVGRYCAARLSPTPGSPLIVVAEPDCRIRWATAALFG